MPGSAGARLPRDAAAASAPAPRHGRAARVFAFTSDDPYTSCFNTAVRALGVEVREGSWSGRWLRAHVRAGDVIHFHWPSFFYTHRSRLLTWWWLVRFALFTALLRVRGATIVWTAHNLYPHDSGRALVHRLGRRVVVRLASWVCVHGRAAAELVQREFHVRTRSLLLLEHGNWIDFYPNTLTRQLARERLQIPPEAFVYLFLGQCKPYKNLELLVASYAALADDSRLWIVGRFSSPAYSGQVEREAHRAGAAHLTLVDRFVPDEELQLYLNACDTVVLPYREVLTSGAAMLALSFARPVVAPRMGVLPELVTGDCGILYDPLSATGLTEAMRAARARHFEPATISARARQFSWARSAETFVRAILRGREPISLAG
jgi:beta-1,4-mannosyltransferase